VTEFVRMYRRGEDGTLSFREAWYDAADGQFVINHGTVGHQSTTRENPGVAPEEAPGLLDAFAGQCAADGFAELAREEQSWVVAQYALKSAGGTERDRYLEDKAKAVLAEHLAWRGLGTVERSEFVPHRLNIYVLSPDAAKAVAAVKTCLREAKLDFTKLSIGVAPYADLSAIRQKHPMPAKAPFSLA
jgi:hypothetical protein